MNNKKINEDLINFWNSALIINDEDKKEYQNNELDYHNLSPSIKQIKALANLKKCNNVLDYGCGTCWASIIASKSGANNITAVDMGEEIIKTAKFYIDLYHTTNIKPLLINEDWLKEENDNNYDGLICSNVLDVIPLETSKKIIKEFHRILTNDAYIIISLNFYMTKEMQEKRNIQLVEDKYLFVNDILRLTNLSDDEWLDLFKPYFDLINLDYYAWPNESKETRRLFILKKRVY